VGTPATTATVATGAATTQAPVCTSCGGPIASSGETSYRCLFCKTAFEIGANDSAARRELIDRNAARWLDIAGDKERFAAAIRRAAEHEARRAVWRSRTTQVLRFVVPLFAVCGLIALLVPARFAADGGQLLPLAIIVAMVLAGLFAFSELRRLDRDAAQSEARAILGQALARYRSMSSQPADELLHWLCDPRAFGDPQAARIVAQVHGELAAASRQS
jgi:hypothetical protein